MLEVILPVVLVAGFLWLNVTYWLALDAWAQAEADASLWGKRKNNGYSGWREAVYLYAYDRRMKFDEIARQRAND